MSSTAALIRSRSWPLVRCDATTEIRHDVLDAKSASGISQGLVLVILAMANGIGTKRCFAFWDGQYIRMMTGNFRARDESEKTMVLRSISLHPWIWSLSAARTIAAERSCFQIGRGLQGIK